MFQQLQDVVLHLAACRHPRLCLSLVDASVVGQVVIIQMLEEQIYRYRCLYLAYNLQLAMCSYK